MVIDNNEERFLRDHNNLHKVSEADDKEILIWADKKRYITLVHFEDNLYYTLQDLETALMWYDKIYS